MEQAMMQFPEEIVAGKKRPFTGTEFLQSLRDGREVFIYGERVKDVTTHPALRNSAASVACHGLHGGGNIASNVNPFGV